MQKIYPVVYANLQKQKQIITQNKKKTPFSPWIDRASPVYIYIPSIEIYTFVFLADLFSLLSSPKPRRFSHLLFVYISLHLLNHNALIFPRQELVAIDLSKGEYLEMDGDIFSLMTNGNQVDGKIFQTCQEKFVQVQNILDQNRLLINEINQNHESKVADNLSRNVGLIRELNNNIRRVVDLYAELSNSFAKSMEASSESESAKTLNSDGRAGQKRIRSG